MNSLIVDLHISPEEYQRLYREAIRTVFARSRDGRSVQFPVSALRNHVGRDGIRGTFRIIFDQNNKLKSVEKL